MNCNSELKQARQAAGLTQRESADILGIHLKHYQKLEAGTHPVKSQTLEYFRMKTKPPL